MSSVNRKRPNEPAIVVPKPSDDRPKYGRVGLIAGIGFVVGIAWPGLARLELVPQPPNDDRRTPSSLASAMQQPSSELAPTLPPAGAGVVAESKDKVGPTAKVRMAEVVSCVDADGKKHKKCGEFSLDKQLVEPLKSLVACDGVSGTLGVLSLGFDVDFDAQQLNGFTVGRSTTLPSSLAADLLTCAKSVLSKVEFSSVPHGYNSYRVFYLVEFSSREDSAAPAAPTEAAAGSAEPAAEVQGASGRATVAWEVALIRKTPKEGAIVARVLGGTRLVVTGRQGDWYRVKYDVQGNEGYVFKSAIGM